MELSQNYQVWHFSIFLCVSKIQELFLSQSQMSKPTLPFVQLDVPLAGAKFGILPKYLPARVNVDDFVFFSWPHTMNPSDYVVAVETLDTSDPRTPYRTIGPLSANVELPFVIFGAYARIFVLPKTDPRKPSFWGRLNRGSTYHINQNLLDDHKPGDAPHQMVRHGMLTAGVSMEKAAY
jgi:hypothetical protein